jgi:hypothetical protein
MLETKVANILGLRDTFTDPVDLLQEMGLRGQKVYKNKPKACRHCHSTEFDKVELLAIHDKPILWECTECLSLYLRYSLSYITGKFSQVKHLWTDELSWEVPPRSQFN